MGKFIDLTGQKYNKLTVIEGFESKNRHSQWRCLCGGGN